MPRDFDRQPLKRAPYPRRERRPADFGLFVPDEPPRKPRLTVGRVVARLIAIVIAFLALSLVFGSNVLTYGLAVLGGLALYEMWYLTFESSTW